MEQSHNADFVVFAERVLHSLSRMSIHGEGVIFDRPTSNVHIDLEEEI